MSRSQRRNRPRIAKLRPTKSELTTDFADFTDKKGIRVIRGIRG
jgi:hypothetical protein